MSIQQHSRKTRALSFRLSEADYELLLNGYVASGTASLSEYARTHFAQSLRSGSVGSPNLETLVNKLHEDLESLRQKVEEVTKHVGLS